MSSTLPWNKRPVVISGPSGSGKSTLLKLLFEKHPDALDTTRAPRPGEENGKAYHFVSTEEFQRLIDANEFLEWAVYSKNHYGTSLSSMRAVQAAGQIPLLDIDLAGVKSVKALGPAVQARFVFVQTPDLATLERRLRDRGTESEDTLQSRLAIAEAELAYAHASPDAHHLIIINDDLQRAYQQLEDFIFNEQQP